MYVSTYMASDCQERGLRYVSYSEVPLVLNNLCTCSASDFIPERACKSHHASAQLYKRLYGY